MSTGFVVDSASDIPFDWAEKHGIKVVPLDVTFDGVTHTEDKDFDTDAYYQNFEDRDLFKVTTNQPPPARFLDPYNELMEEGCKDIICTTISSGLSGTYNSAVIAKRELEEENDINVHVVDSKSASVAVLYLIKLGLKLRKEGLSADEIASAMDERVYKISTMLSLPTLKYLRAGGRVSFPKFVIGRLFRLKPITKVNLETGENEVVATSFTLNSGNQKVYNRTTNNGEKLAKSYKISHSNAPDRAAAVEDIIRKKQPDVEIEKYRVRSSISAHAGPGAIALFALFDEKLL